MKGKILYTWISTWFCTLTAKFIVMQYHIYLTDVDLKGGLQSVSINLLTFCYGFLGVWLWGGRRQSCFIESFELLYEFSNLLFNWDDAEVRN